jgi:hypothetical protein
LVLKFYLGTKISDEAQDLINEALKWNDKILEDAKLFGVEIKDIFNH